METLETIRRRLDTGESLHSLVRTMRVLASVSIRQYEEAARSLESYVRSVALGFQVALRGRHAPPGRLSEAGIGRLGAVVLGSSQGLAGRFNDQVARLAVGRVEQLDPAHLSLLAYGPFVPEHLAAAGRPPDRTLELPGSVGAITEAVQELLVEVEAWRRELAVDRVLLFHNVHTGKARFSPHMRWLLPLDPEWLEDLAGRPWGGPSLPTHRVGREQLLGALVREHLFVACYRAFAESLAAEHASRLAAMQTAERRIEERLDELRSRYRRERQASITAELMDIVSGYEALTAEERQAEGESPA